MQHIQRGMKFLHKRVIDATTKRPMLYEVTRLANGGVYYRPVDGGKSEYCEIETFEPRVVKEWLRDDAVAAE